MIQLDHIDVTFQQKKRQIQAVKDVTIHIQERDIYGIVGYSGAGKSTLVRVINLLQVPTSGKIIVDDDVLFDNKVTLTAEQLRRKRQDIGMIFQHFNLMSQLTAEENVAFALKHSGLSKEEKKEKRGSSLTVTECEILKLMALGKTTKEIAAERFLSVYTVMTHRKNIFRKLEVNNVYEATKYALRAGIVDAVEYYI